MRIILDNRDEKEFNRVVMIQQEVECLNELISLFVDSLKAFGYSEEEISEVLIPTEENEE